MSSHWSREIKEFPVSVTADCGLLNKTMGRIMIPLTKLRNSYRWNSYRGKWCLWILKLCSWKWRQHTRIMRLYIGREKWLYKENWSHQHHCDHWDLQEAWGFFKAKEKIRAKVRERGLGICSVLQVCGRRKIREGN